MKHSHVIKLFILAAAITAAACGTKQKGGSPDGSSSDSTSNAVPANSDPTVVSENNDNQDDIMADTNTVCIAEDITGSISNPLEPIITEIPSGIEPTTKNEEPEALCTLVKASKYTLQIDTIELNDTGNFFSTQAFISPSISWKPMNGVYMEAEEKLHQAQNTLAQKQLAYENASLGLEKLEDQREMLVIANDVARQWLKDSQELCLDEMDQAETEFEKRSEQYRDRLKSDKPMECPKFEASIRFAKKNALRNSDLENVRLAAERLEKLDTRIAQAKIELKQLSIDYSNAKQDLVQAERAKIKAPETYVSMAASGKNSTWQATNLFEVYAAKNGLSVPVPVPDYHLDQDELSFNFRVFQSDDNEILMDQYALINLAEKLSIEDLEKLHHGGTVTFSHTFRWSSFDLTGTSDKYAEVNFILSGKVEDAKKADIKTAKSPSPKTKNPIPPSISLIGLDASKLINR